MPLNLDGMGVSLETGFYLVKIGSNTSGWEPGFYCTTTSKGPMWQLLGIGVDALQPAVVEVGERIFLPGEKDGNMGTVFPSQRDEGLENLRQENLRLREALQSERRKFWEQTVLHNVKDFDQARDDCAMELSLWADLILIEWDKRWPRESVEGKGK